MSSYFTYFPSLLYNNAAVTNIMAKARFDASVIKNNSTFFPFVIEEAERADQIAEYYYGDARFDWVVYLSNNITDPYHEWPQDDATFNRFIIKKYDSSYNAQSQISHYRVNYEVDDTVLSPAAFDALSSGQKQYWVPILGYSEQVTNYERKRLDLVSDTNKIITLNGSFGQLKEGDIIKQSTVAQGTVSFANTTNVVVKHIVGGWQANVAVSFSSNVAANASISSVTTISQPIPAEQLAYWSAVTFYEYEENLNAQRKNIQLISADHIDAIERDMRDVMSV